MTSAWHSDPPPDTSVDQAVGSDTDRTNASTELPRSVPAGADRGPTRLDRFPENARKFKEGMGYVWDTVRDGADASTQVARAVRVWLTTCVAAVMGGAGAFVACRIAASDLDLLITAAWTGVGTASGLAAGGVVSKVIIQKRTKDMAAIERQEDVP